MDIEASGRPSTIATEEQHSWPQNDHSVVAMAHMNPDLDDLSNIFDIANFDLDSIQAVDAEHFGEPMQNVQTSTHATPFLDALVQPLQGSLAHDFADATQPSTMIGEEGRQSHHNHHFDAQQPQPGVKFGNGQFHGSAWQHYPSPQSQPYGNGLQDQFGPNARIPPTPNSYEMHGEAGHFLQQQQVMFAQQAHLRNMENQMHPHPPHLAHFTPMTSPSGTPQYAMQPEFTTPGAYFSPLTSPALHAQMQPNGAQHVLQQAQGYFTNPSTAPNSNAPSPVDLGSADIDMVDSAFANESTAKKGRKKLVTPRSVGPTARVRQSPIQKPQKRKSGLLTSSVPGRDLETAIVESHVQATSHPSSAAARVSQAFDSSESGSISPEPLSEALMRPPPRPATAIQSPSMAAFSQKAAEAALVRKAAAATPKSILSMRGDGSLKLDSPETTSLLATPTVTAVGQMSLDDLELPEAASKQTSRRTSVVLKADGQPRSGPLTVDTARKTPKLGPLSTPSSARPEDSPSIAPSPASATTPAALLKDKKNGTRSSRSLSKRSSVGGTLSATASPALRPRISPSIKPLLPEGSALHSPTHALLLASKSNYQNLLEGNHLPGVNYPDSLSTGLTSKRTSHKVAEQGRRNRINEALKEMQSLIPAPALMLKSSSDDNVTAMMKEEDDSADAGGADCDGKDGKESASAKSNSSKAATVESANRYIRQLKESEVSSRAAILALKQEIEDMRIRLAEATGGSVDGIDSGNDMPSIQEHEISAED